MTYKEFVESRIECDPEEQEPFCPFSTKNCMGYCNCAYSESCYNCEESLGEYVTRTYDCGEYLCDRVFERFDYMGGLTMDQCKEFTKECLDNIKKWEDEAHENLAE